MSISLRQFFKCAGVIKRAANGGKKLEEKRAEKKWTPQDDAATRIQIGMRGYLARKHLAQLKKEKEDYDKLMDELEKEVCPLYSYIVYRDCYFF